MADFFKVCRHAPAAWFLAGQLFQMAVTGMVQDFRGKEATLAKIAENWVDSNITGPVWISLAILVSYLFLKNGVPSAEVLLAVSSISELQHGEHLTYHNHSDDEPCNIEHQAARPAGSGGEYGD